MFNKNFLQNGLMICIIIFIIGVNQLSAKDDTSINFHDSDLIKVPCEYKVITTQDSTPANTVKSTNILEENTPQGIKSGELYKEGVNALNDKDFEKAASFFKRSLKENIQNIKAFNNLGVAYRNQGQIDKAIETFEEALKIAPDSTLTYQLLGVAYLYKGDYELALKNFEKFKQLDPQNPEVYFSIGNARSFMQNYQDSNYNYLKAIDLYTDNQEYLKSDAYFNIGSNYFKQNNFEEAISYYEKALTSNRSNKEAMYFTGLSNIYKSPRDVEEAKKYILKAGKAGYQVPPVIQKILSKDD